ncbi:MAG: hypothetical protein ACM31O_03365 [Bacteroidota bacterium]
MEMEIEQLLAAFQRESAEEARVINEVLTAIANNARSRRELIERLRQAVLPSGGLTGAYAARFANRPPPMPHEADYPAFMHRYVGDAETDGLPRQ